MENIVKLSREDITQERDSNNEENVKVKVVVKLLQALGWEDNEIDFESDAGSGKIDVLLKIERIPQVIIEIKSYEQDLLSHRSQVFRYSRTKGVKQFILTNGNIFEFYQIRLSWDQIDEGNLNPNLILQREDFIQKEGVLRYYLGRTELGILSAFSTSPVNNNYLELRKILSNLKIHLFLNLREKIIFQYQRNPDYHRKLDAWIKKIQWEQSWTWTDNFTGRSKNKFLKRKVETILKENNIFLQEKSCKEHQKFTVSCEKCRSLAQITITDNWLKLYNKRKKENDPHIQNIDKILRENGLTLDIFDKFALEGAYTLINRLLFIRYYEDNTGQIFFGPQFNLELQQKTSNQAASFLIRSVFEEASQMFQKIFGSPLFNDTFLEEVACDKFILEKILHTLQSFDFRALSIDLLGHLYEENLDRDVRNVIGQFYTPRPIIEFIIQQLELEDFVKSIESGKIPFIIDPACGSGGFLIVFYNTVKEIMQKRHWNSKDIFQVLSSSIYGLDIDNFAVQLSIMNLLLKEHPSNIGNASINIFQIDSIKFPLTKIHQALHVSMRMKDGVSLVSSEDQGNQSISIQKLSEMRFRFIFGNPPFFEIQKFDAFNDYYPELKKDKKPNIASLFLLRYANLLEPNGTLAFLFPASILFSDAYINVRQTIVNNFSIECVVQLGRAFSDVGLEQIVLILQKRQMQPNHKVKVIHNLKDILDASKYSVNYVFQSYFENDPRIRFRIFSDEASESLLTKIEHTSKPLKDYCVTYRQGNQEIVAIFRGLGWEKNLKYDRSPGIAKPAVKGTNIMRYGVKETGFVPNPGLERSIIYNLIAKNPKIGVQRLVSSRSRLVATSLPPDILTISTITTMILKEKDPSHTSFIVGLLNSDFMTYYVIDHLFMRCRLSTSLDSEYAKFLPIPNIMQNEQESFASIVGRLENIVQDGIQQNLNPEAIEDLPEFKEQNNALNNQVYSFFGLNQDEIDLMKQRISEFYGDEQQDNVV